MLVVALRVGVDGVAHRAVAGAGKGVAGGTLQGKGNSDGRPVAQSNARATGGLARAIAR